MITEDYTNSSKDKKNKSTHNNRVLKPHGIGVWLLTNYPSLNILQISQFCKLDQLKIGFLKTELNNGKRYPMTNPILMGYVTKHQLEEAAANPHSQIPHTLDHTLKITVSKRKYISLQDRKNNLSAAAWIVHYYPQIPPEEVKGLTRASLVSVKKLLNDRKYALSIVPIDPIKFNICTRKDLETMLSRYTIINHKI